ncbi:MAG: amidohydrolase [Thaumarchaeota archaeon]|nr:amidohydrolase [Nitrososphaerota archaeon]
MKRVLIKDCRLEGVSECSVFCEDGKVTEISEGSLTVPDGTEVVEANGGALFPGFTDSHCHPFEYGWLKRSIDLRGTTNITGIRLRLQAGIQRAKRGEWVTGMGWDQEAFAGGSMPTRAEIDDISPANPVALSRIDGHIALLNSRAIEALGFAGRVGDEYDRDGAGELTGIVKERVLTEVFARVPRSAERAAADLQSVEAEAARLGLTTLHCIVSPEGFREELEALAALQESGSLSLRYRVYIPPESLDFVDEKGLRERFQGEGVRINGVKIYADGSLGSRTAALREPYSDDPGNIGLLRHTDEELAALVERVDSKGYQAIVHAIGDRAVEQAVDALVRVTGPGNPRRHRIEHASLLPRDLRSRMGKQGIRAAVQPLFITSDTWALDRLGEERVRDLYPIRSMIEEGIVASGSSDCPVESLSPILGVWASMTRGGSVPEESLALEQALSLYTSNAASNGLDESDPHLKEGSPANMTLLDSSTSGMHPALLRKVGVLATVVNGSVVHSYGAP